MLGKKFDLDRIEVVAVYDSSTRCDRCDLFDHPTLFKYCPQNFNAIELEHIDCEYESVVFKIVLDIDAQSSV